LIFCVFFCVFLFSFFKNSLLPVSIPKPQTLPYTQKKKHSLSTAPPVNQSTFHEWTVGATYYSAIVLAETLGKTNTSRIIDLGANGGNGLTPAYAIYEQDSLSKVALINYMDDNQTEANALSVTIQVPTGVPGSVQVKYVGFFFFSKRLSLF
jgi:hypothetical protein